MDFKEIPGQRKARFPPLSIIALAFKGTRIYTSLYVVWLFGLVLAQFFPEAKAYSASPNCSRVSQYETLKWFLLLHVQIVKIFQIKLLLSNSNAENRH